MSEGGWGDTQKGCRKPKTMTVTWMVTLTRLIPVTVDTFDAPKRMSKPKNDDSYMDGDPDPPDPCDNFLASQKS